MRLLGVGEVIAKRIIDYRERQRPSRRPEEIMIIQGFSDIYVIHVFSPVRPRTILTHRHRFGNS